MDRRPEVATSPDENDDMKLPTIDSLKRDVRKIHYFGLGFVQVNISESARYNFYHPRVPAFVDEPHDHRYNFVSRTKKGTLLNSIWVIDDLGQLTGTLRNESCRKDVPPVGEPVPVRLSNTVSFGTHLDMSYALRHDVLHTVEPLLKFGPVITYVERGPIVKEFARVFVKEGHEKVCAFSKNLPEDELWDIVNECLKE